MNNPTNQRRKATILFSLLLILTIHATDAAASFEVDGVFGISPAGPENYLAVEITHGPGQALSGLSWYHNDELADFPRLILMEGERYSPPDLANSALILEELSGESLAWGDAELQTPVTSTTGIIYAVFAFPEDDEREGEGTGGGPGMGYRHDAAATHARAFVTADGETWMPVHADYAVAVVADWSAGKRAPVSLASLRGEDSTSDELAQQERTPEAIDTTPLRVYPNPFNPRTTVRLYLEKPGRATVRIYDIRGRLVETMLDERLERGERMLVWEGTDSRGENVASGVYYLKAELGEDVHHQRLSLIR